MRKLSTIMLAVLAIGLVIGMSSGVYAGTSQGTKSATANASFGVEGNISLEITDGSTVFFGEDLKPGKKHEEKDATTLKVDSNIDMNWQINTEKSVTAAPRGMDKGTVKKELTVDLSETTGTGTKSGIKASYTLEDLQYKDILGNTQDFSKGFYQIEVTYTVAAG